MKTAEKNCVKYQVYLSVILMLLSGGWASGQLYNPGKYSGTGQTQNIIRVASASVVPEKWNKEINWQRTEKMVRRAVLEGGAGLVITPECILDGYIIEEANQVNDTVEKKRIIEKFKNIAESLDGPFVRKACQLADELNIWFIFGFLEKKDDRLYNTAILIDKDGDITGRYCKTHFAEGYTIKPGIYTPGSDYPVFDTPFGKAGIIICYDRQLPEPARIMALKGAQILFIPAYGSFTDENGWNTVLLRCRAYENKFPVVFCNPFQSLMIDQGGNLKASGNAGEIIYYDFSTSPAGTRNRFSTRRGNTYHEMIDSGKQ